MCFLQADDEGEPIKPGVLPADGGRFDFKAVDQGVRLTRAGRIGGIVSARLSLVPTFLIVSRDSRYG